jgi:hypothetical protein
MNVLLLRTAALAVSGLLFQPAPVSADRTKQRLYERVMERALTRAGDRLVASKDLWVDHSSWENAWEVSSDHFTVKTTASRFLGQKIANDLEFMLTQFQALLGTDYRPSRRFQVWILPTLGDYNVLGQGRADEHSSFYGSYHALQEQGQPVATYYTSNTTQLGMWITHSALHQFVTEAFGGQPPLWVSEGLASYFSFFWDWQWARGEYAKLLEGRGSLIPLTQLLTAGLPEYMQDPDQRLIQLGTLFDYLLNHREDTRIPEEGEEEPSASFREYLRAVVRGGSGAQTGFANLSASELGTIESELRAFDWVE